MFEIVATLLLVACIFLSALFSGSEMALFSLPRAEVLSYKDSKVKSEVYIYRLMNRYDKTLTAIILGNMFVNSCISMLNDELLNALPWSQTVIAVISVLSGVLILLFFGEITPMTIAYANAKSWARHISVPLYYFRKGISWLIDGVSLVSDGCLNLMGRTTPKPLDYNEYCSYIDTCVENSVFSAQHGLVLKEIFQLQHRTLVSVMCARVDLVCVDESDSADVVVDKIHRSGRAFLPVSKSGIDNADALLNSLEFYRLSGEEREQWHTSKAIHRNLPFLPEQTPLSKACELIRSSKASAAFVMDEYGGLGGIISLQDIYAEIIGQSVELSDAGNCDVSQEAKNMWTFDGSCPLAFVRENSAWTNCNLDGVYRSTTLNGLFCEVYGALPEAGTTIRIDDFELKALAVSRQKIDKITVRVVPATDGGDDLSRHSPFVATQDLSRLRIAKTEASDVTGDGMGESQ